MEQEEAHDDEDGVDDHLEEEEEGMIWNCVGHSSPCSPRKSSPRVRFEEDTKKAESKEEQPVAIKRRSRRMKSAASVLELHDLTQDSFLKDVGSKEAGWGLHDPEQMRGVIRTLSHIEAEAPFAVVPFNVLKEHGRIPRSDSGLTTPGKEMLPGTKVAFLSHRWLRPWPSEEETLANGKQWAGGPHPDDEENSKFNLIINGIEHLAREREWHLDLLAVWLDFACVEQDDQQKRQAGVNSLLGYMARCKFIIIPALEAPKYPVVHRMPSDYGIRAWTRLESLGFYILSLISDARRPELYYTAPNNQVGHLDYVLLPYTMPSAGILAKESDRKIISKHEQCCLDVLHHFALAGSEAAQGPDMVASAGLGKAAKLERLLEKRVSVNTADHSGITALWSASRQGHTAIVKFLLSRGAHVNQAPNSGLAPLHAAALEDHVDVIDALIADHADPEQADRDGLTAITWATSHNQHRAVQALLDAGSDDRVAQKIAEELGDRMKLEITQTLQERSQSVRRLRTAMLDYEAIGRRRQGALPPQSVFDVAISRARGRLQGGARV